MSAITTFSSSSRNAGKPFHPGTYQSRPEAWESQGQYFSRSLLNLRGLWVLTQPPPQAVEWLPVCRNSRVVVKIKISLNSSELSELPNFGTTTLQSLGRRLVLTGPTGLTLLNMTLHAASCLRLSHDFPLTFMVIYCLKKVTYTGSSIVYRIERYWSKLM